MSMPKIIIPNLTYDEVDIIAGALMDDIMDYDSKAVVRLYKRFEKLHIDNMCGSYSNDGADSCQYQINHKNKHSWEVE
jgi:hypothetical protein